MKILYNVVSCNTCKLNLFSCHRTASYAHYWMNRTLLSVCAISRLHGKNPHNRLEVFGDRKFLADFFEFLSTEFAACSKPPRRGNHRKASYLRTQ